MFPYRNGDYHDATVIKKTAQPNKNFDIYLQVFTICHLTSKGKAHYLSNCLIPSKYKTFLSAFVKFLNIYWQCVCFQNCIILVFVKICVCSLLIQAGIMSILPYVQHIYQFKVNFISFVLQIDTITYTYNNNNVNVPLVQSVNVCNVHGAYSLVNNVYMIKGFVRNQNVATIETMGTHRHVLVSLYTFDDYIQSRKALYLKDASPDHQNSKYVRLIQLGSSRESRLCFCRVTHILLTHVDKIEICIIIR